MKPNALPLDQLMPASLDDIIRKNRHRARLYRSTEAELAALQGAIPIRSAKGKIADWCFITFLLTEIKEELVYLTGFNETERSSWMTSFVIAINGSAVLTKSGSIYTLVGHSSIAPDLPHVCATLNLWGIGPTFGVPPFFF